MTPYSPQPEERIRRVIAYLIDVVPMLLLALLHLLPIFGWILYGLLHVFYWLLRDINGASPGKLVMGTVVAAADGTRAGGSPTAHESRGALNERAPATPPRLTRLLSTPAPAPGAPRKC